MEFSTQFGGDAFTRKLIIFWWITFFNAGGPHNDLNWQLILVPIFLQFIRMEVCVLVPFL